MRKKICVIGGGASGIVCIKELLDEGQSVVCYEKLDYLGGLWKYHDEDVDGVASVMRSTIINSSKEMSAYSNFPPPKEYPNYMHNSLMIKYLEKFAEHAGVQPYINFKHEVLNVIESHDYEETGRWKVTVKNLETNEVREEVYDAVMVCNGHHWKPHIPTFPGQEKFNGEIIHTHSYKTPNKYDGKTVVVLGVGNSGGDAAVELSMLAKQVYLSTRSGCWITHRVGPNGYPQDSAFLRRYLNSLYHIIPYNLVCHFVEGFINSKFDHEKYSIKPKHRIFGQHPMVNDALPNRILSGTVIVKSGISEFTEDGVKFEGETDVTKCDVVILATGYEVSIPFINKDLVWTSDNEVKLYKYVFNPYLKHPETLALIGYVQAVGPAIPISEMQARWFAQIITGNVKLPSQKEMIEDIIKKRKAISERYFQSIRHTIQIDWIDFLDELASLIDAKPHLYKYFFTDFKLWCRLCFGPSLTYQYRLNGPHPWAGARNAILSVNERIYDALKTRKMIESNESKSTISTSTILFRGFISFFALIILVFNLQWLLKLNLNNSVIQHMRDFLVDNKFIKLSKGPFSN